MKPFHFPVTSIAVVLLLSACAGDELKPAAPAASAPPVVHAATTTGDDHAFQTWVTELRREARAKGISERTLDAAFAGLKPITRVVELDRKQPEFTQTFWRYLDGAVSPARVRDGAARLAEHRDLLQRLEQKYGVQGRFLVAFWGLETNYGRNLGSYPVVHALATLAYDGRRSAFFRAELFEALSIIDKGHIAPDKMVGSWAGAMGQTQFMPSTFQKHAVDETGDGRIDVWGQTADALGSGAHYLQNLGWNGNQTWGREVRLPKNFDFNLASLDGNAKDIVKPLAEWSALGVTRTDGSALPKQDLQAALVIPAGAKGPAFLVYDNFGAILKWNRSVFYALAIGHLADRITGAPPLVGTRINEEPLSREQVMALQSKLHLMGLLKAEPDGVIGSATRQALRKYQQKCNLPADGFANQQMVLALAGENSGSSSCGTRVGGVALDDSSR
jgi:membrane-bound lytic murein transglycosylase B